MLTGTFAALPVNPPLPRMLAALPVAGLQLAQGSADVASPGAGPRPEYALGRRWIERSGARWTHHLMIARVPCAIVAAAGTVVCYHWAGKLYGPRPALVAALLWATCPLVLGHGCLVRPDVAASVLGAAAVRSFLTWAQQPRWLEAIIAGITLGAAELCKFTLLILYAILAVLWLLCRLTRNGLAMPASRGWLSESAMLGAITLISVLVINCGYLFENSFRPLGDFRFQSAMFTGRSCSDGAPAAACNRFAGTWLGRIRIPVPAVMVEGIDLQRSDFERGLPSYLRGEWANHGWWHYYLYAAGIKLPLGTLLVICVAGAVSVVRPIRGAMSCDELGLMVPGLAILLFVSSQTGFSMHFRYAMPVLPFAFIWASKVAQPGETPHRVGTRAMMRAIVGAAVTWSVVSSLWTYPHSLSYFNELAGGPLRGGKHLIDSNIDWGQDLLYLRRWLSKHPEVTVDGLACYSSYPLSRVGIPEAHMPAKAFGLPNTLRGSPEARGAGAAARWYVISLCRLYSPDGQYSFFRTAKPVAMAGYSIYIYRVESD